ncbi:MAG: hypothetical protein IJ368_02920 [Oscillospiraceae bacterium]|nr:hypothetical protein [Oscillospiraceae bacterium]
MKSHAVSLSMAACLLCILPSLAGCSRINETPSETSYVNSESSLSASEEKDNSCYIYNLLSEKEKEYYNILRDAAMNFEPTAVFPEKIEPEILRKIFVAVYYQEESIFWLTSMFFRPTEPTDTLKLTYRFGSEDIPAMQSELEIAADEIFSEFSDKTTDYEKLKTFHDRLVTGCTFSKDNEYGNTVYGALCAGYAQCEGYAFAFDYLCRKADIDCFTVMGTNPEGDAHAWNMVMLDNMWYHVDCTWDDPILDPPDKEFIRHYYFLTADSDICGITHIPDSTYFELPSCTSGINYYKREGLLAASAAEGIDMLAKSAGIAAEMGRKDAAVRFADRSSYDTAVSRLFDGNQVRKVMTEYNSVSDRQVLENKYIRYCNDDELIIHISMIYEDSQ